MNELNEFFAHTGHSANRIDLIMETEFDDDQKFYWNYATPIDICRVGSVRSDEVSRGLLKLVASYILLILEYIFNHCLMHGIFPVEVCSGVSSLGENCM